MCMYACLVLALKHGSFRFYKLNTIIKIDPGDPWKSLDRVQPSKGERSWEASPSANAPASTHHLK